MTYKKRMKPRNRTIVWGVGLQYYYSVIRHSLPVIYLLGYLRLRTIGKYRSTILAELKVSLKCLVNITKLRLSYCSSQR